MRANEATIVVGRKFTGKSTNLNKIMEAYPADKKRLIIDVNGSPAYSHHELLSYEHFRYWKKGVKRFYDQNHNRMLSFLPDYYKNGAIVFEDCTKYIPANPPDKIKAFLVDHRMWNVDLFFTFHSLWRVPPFFWEMTSNVIIHKTQDIFEGPESKYRERYPNWPAIKEAHAQVMAHESEYYTRVVKTLI